LATLVSDTFTGTNGTSLDAHTPNTAPGGSVWVEQAGNWEIQSNKAKRSTSGSQEYSVIDAGTAIDEATCLITISASGDAGIIFRETDTNHYYVLVVSNTSFRMFENNAGFTDKGSNFGLTLTAGNTYTARGVWTGNDFEAFLDGVSVLTVTGLTLNTTSGRTGIRSSDTDTSSFDDFTVLGPAPAGSTGGTMRTISRLWGP
jgi:hypothetical protein